MDNKMNNEEWQEWIDSMDEVPYGDFGSALFDGEYYYNFSGEKLRDPDEYEDCYFGDEGY